MKDTFTINSHLVNQFAVGYGRYQSDSVTPNRRPYSATAPASSTCLLVRPPTASPESRTRGTYTSPSTQGGYSWNNKINNTYTVTDNLQWVFGKHNLTSADRL